MSGETGTEEQDVGWDGAVGSSLPRFDRLDDCLEDPLEFFE
jgi:hypothetical protein